MLALIESLRQGKTHRWGKVEASVEFQARLGQVGLCIRCFYFIISLRYFHRRKLVVSNCFSAKMRKIKIVNQKESSSKQF